MDIILTALVGLVGGVIGSLIAPWVQWAVEKRRRQVEYRRELIQSWRAEIEAFDHEANNFGDTAAYSAIRSHLRSEVREAVEKPRTFYVGGGRGDMVKKHKLLDEVARIEKEWELV